MLPRAKMKTLLSKNNLHVQLMMKQGTLYDFFPHSYVVSITFLQLCSVPLEFKFWFILSTSSPHYHARKIAIVESYCVK